MEIQTITEENVAEYREILDPDAAENIGRKYYRALALHADPDASPQGVLIWKLVHDPQRGRKTTAWITWFTAADPKAGKLLLAECEKELAGEDVIRVCCEWPGDRQDIEALAFAEAGFILKETKNRERIVTVDELSKLAGKGKPELSPNIVSIDQLMLRQFQKGIMNCLFHGRAGALEDLDTLPVGWFQPKVSCCVQSKGQVNGFLLFHETPSGKLAVKLLFACKPATNQDLLGMIRFAIMRVQENYPPQTQVVIRPYDEATDAFVRKLFPNAENQMILEATKEGSEDGAERQR
ncbi:MAG: hypothetical protein PUK75_03160 [bacterium]|nr:hypothetical protein [bacterium]MDY4099381.1 hypothetical protein [Lachnospiraceae bacterium]